MWIESPCTHPDFRALGWCQEEMTRLNWPSEVSISDEGVYSSPGATAWTKATLMVLNFWQLRSASADASVAALQWVNSSHFCVFAALTSLCKCVFVQALPWSALLNPRPLPCNASKTIHLRPPRERRVFALFDGWGSPLHPRCGLESRDGWCHYASHLCGRCSGNVSFRRRPPCWTLMESCVKSGIVCRRRACLLTWAFGESLQFTMTWFEKSQATRNWPTPARGDVENLTGLGNGFLFKRLQSLDWNTIREWRTLTLA